MLCVVDDFWYIAYMQNRVWNGGKHEEESIIYSS